MGIQILPPQLANQIAAGEVVERPASVVKELIENSLDAGATQIEVEIERGGSQLIRIRDNGCGISKTELGLALSRHATSKVSSLKDLEQIMSLGFRGEALASISSVSRLTLTSKNNSQHEAWSALAEGRDMAVNIQPAAHPTGTSVEVADLFFNTPARRRFLRTDKTEYAHIDEVIRRVALSRFDVQIKLSHNGSLQRHYRVAKNQAGQHRRIAAVCSKNFIDNAINIHADYDGIKLTGWLGLPVTARNQADMQYCYINGRMMRDKLINHAIRQAYSDKIPSDLYPAYVLYIEIDPKQVDVNVHPSKHEVRFHQARLVHDFIFQSLERSLQQGIEQQTLDSIAPEEPSEIPASALSSETSEQAQSSGQNPPYAQAKVAEASLESYQTQAVQTQAYQSQPALQVEKSTTYDNASLFNNLSDGAKKLFPGQTQPTKAQTQFLASNRANTGSAKNLSAQMSQYQHLLQPEVATENIDIKPADRAQQQTSESDSHQWQLIMPIAQTFVLASRHDNLYLLKADELYAAALAAKLKHNYQQAQLISQPLLLPVAIKLNEQQSELLTEKQAYLTKLGIATDINRSRTLIVKKVPAMFRELDLAQLIATWLTAYQLNDNAGDDFPNQAAFLLTLKASQCQTLELEKIRPIFNEWKQFDPTTMQQWLLKHSKIIDISKVIGNW